MSFHDSLISSQATTLASATSLPFPRISSRDCRSAAATEARRNFICSAVFGGNGEAGGVMGKSGELSVEGLREVWTPQSKKD